MTRSNSEPEKRVEGEELIAQIAWSDTMLDCEVCQRLFAMPPEASEAIMLDWARTVAHEASEQGWIAEADGPSARVLCPACATHGEESTANI